MGFPGFTLSVFFTGGVKVLLTFSTVSVDEFKCLAVQVMAQDSPF